MLPSESVSPTRDLTKPGKASRPSRFPDRMLRRHGTGNQARGWRDIELKMRNSSSEFANEPARVLSLQTLCDRGKGKMGAFG
jgi:hypothetical protein